jgi:two-component system NtrC family sensor kinase
MSTPSKRVLLVEDSPTQAARLRMFLTKDDLEVIQVASAELALKQLEVDRPDAIVLDNYLPGMTGNEFCREIRLNVNTRAIPVLMLTAEDSDAAQLQGLASGADDYVVKSVDPDILLVRIRALLRKSENDPAVPDVESRFSRAHLLVINDSPTYLQFIQQALKTEHYHVETATHPDAALQRLDEAHFDCILIAFEAQALDSAEICRRIRRAQAERQPEIILIVFSSHEDKQRMTEGFEAGADDFIFKSADFTVAKSRIRALLRRKFLVEENRRISEEIRQKELQAVRARAEREAAEVRAELADQLAAANRELDRANQELEQFAYAAAHDLQEPLRKVRVFSELLRQRYRGMLDEQADQYIDYCVEGAARMHQLIQDLLAYARASQSGEAVVENVDLNAVLDKVLESLHASIAESAATITRTPLPCVPVEEIRIQQLFQNLIGNALKYRRPEEPPNVRIAAELRGGEWNFAVSDNGVGIDPEHRLRVFDAFKRLDNRQQAGTGLGLAICKRIVENFGGRIWVESEPGTGSVFRFTMPSGARTAKASAD